MRRPTLIRALALASLAVPIATFAQVGAPATHASSAPLSATQIANLSQNPNQNVIIILNNQHFGVSSAVRKNAIAADQVGVLKQLATVNAQKVQAYHVINAIDATVSSAEVANLKSNPAVSEVVPDVKVKMNQPVLTRPQSTGTNGSVTSSALPSSTCSSDPNNPSVEPAGLSLINALPSQEQTIGGQQIDGNGVKVAIIADTLDPNNPDFQPNPQFPRDNNSVITDVEDFSGTGYYTPNGGAEMFGDASSIAAQGNETFNSADFGNMGPQNDCYFKIYGVAPGSDVMSLNVFPNSWSSVILRAIQYAVDNGANVINESLGSEPYPDAAADVFSLANQAAAEAGVTITSSSGDAGTVSGVNSPASDPWVIAVGASTQQRDSVQVNDPMGTFSDPSIPFNGGFVDNNPSSFSSSGITQNGDKTLDVIAPGDSGWSDCSTDTNLYSECGGLGFELFGGTSEAAPLTAGVVALVIQAYRAAHGGADPTPLLVKQIVMGSASDLGLPSWEQGAGLINAQKAVQTAAGYQDVNGSIAQTGANLIYSVAPQNGQTVDMTNQLAAKGQPGTRENFTVQVTNTGSRLTLLRPTVRTLSAPTSTPTQTVSLVNTPTFVDAYGYTRHYTIVSFNVPAGMSHLNAAFSWPSSSATTALVRESLYDPHGNYVGYSWPQDYYAASGYGSVEAKNPTPGTWHAVIWGTSGTISGINFKAYFQRFVSAGSVTPSILPVPAGHTMTLTVHTTLPTTPGDQNDDLVLTSNPNPSGVNPVVPINLRAMVPVNALTGGNFTGNITGGNGRPALSQLLVYEFNVPGGKNDLDLGLNFAASGNNIEGALVRPDGTVADNQSTVNGGGSNPATWTYGSTLQFYSRNPQAGDWKLILFVNNNINGLFTMQPFTGNIRFNQVNVTADTAIPSTIPAGQQKVVHLTIHNTSNETQTYFVEGRLNSSENFLFFMDNNTTDPNGTDLSSPLSQEFFVPTETSLLSAVVEACTADTLSTHPVDLELLNANGTFPYGSQGDPDLEGQPFVNPYDGCDASLASYSANEVEPGYWQTVATLRGPFDPNAGAPTGYLGTEYVTGTTLAPDTNVTTSTGDPYFANTYTPVTIPQGGSAQVTVTITVPANATGTVSGNLYVDSLQTVGPYLTTGDVQELKAIPYSYTVS